MNKKLETNESNAAKEFARLLDESMQRIEDQLNNNIIKNLNDITSRVKDLEFLDDKFRSTEASIKSNFENVCATLNEHIEVLAD